MRYFELEMLNKLDRFDNFVADLNEKCLLLADLYNGGNYLDY